MHALLISPNSHLPLSRQMWQPMQEQVVEGALKHASVFWFLGSVRLEVWLEH